MKRIMKRILLILGGGVVLLIAYFFVGIPRVHPNTVYGITWSDAYAEELGVDTFEGLAAVMDDLGVRRIRLPVYWSKVEPAKGQFDFTRVDRMISAIESRGGKIILVVGATQPRWPECWMPDWVGGVSAAEREERQLAYVDAVLGRYAARDAVEAIQVENEATLILFGKCKDQRKEFLREEIRFVKSKTNKPIITTDSGELSTWLGFRGLTDRRGVSIYRVVWVDWYGIWRYPLPPFFYARKAALVESLVGKIFVSEFQMEPWALAPLPAVSLGEQAKTFDLAQMRSNFTYATKVGLSPIYFWGAEWWYWMKLRGYVEFWETARSFFVSHS